MSELVTELNEVIINVKQFNNDITEGTYIAGKLSEFKHWYFIPELDMFGPSKYIGYKVMTSSNYTVTNDGRDTEKELKKWFRILDEEESQYTPLSVKLNDLHHEHGKITRKNAKIHVFK